MCALPTVHLQAEMQPIVKLELLDTWGYPAPPNADPAQRQRIGEIFSIARDKLSFVCAHCSAEFPLFLQFVAHTQTHLDHFLDQSIESDVKSECHDYAESCTFDDSHSLADDERASDGEHGNQPTADSAPQATTTSQDEKCVAAAFATRTFECFECHLPMLAQTELQVHSRTHKTFPHECRYCKKSFEKFKFKIHVQVCGPTNRVQCPRCPVKVHNKSALYRHRHEFHPNRALFTEHLPDPQQHIFERIYSCNSCPFGAVAIADILWHSKMCDNRMKMCPICKKLVVKRLFKTHSEWHTLANNAEEIEAAERERMQPPADAMKIEATPNDGDSDWSGHWSDNGKVSPPTEEEPETRDGKVMEKYKCQICGKYLMTKQALIVHQKTHRADKQSPRTFECCLCHAPMSTRTKCMAHMRSHQDLPFQCQYCLLKMTTRKLKSHRKLCGPSNEFRCLDCPLQFYSAHARIRHRMVAHERNTARRKYIVHIPDAARPTELYYTCKSCPYKSSKRTSMSSHVKLYCKASKSPCNTCGKLYSEKMMHDHQLTHSGEKSHLCLQCGKLFSTNRALVKHIALHTEVRKYQCDLCEKNYKRSGHLLVHKSKAHSGKFTHICPVCSKGFYNEYMRKRHLETDHSAWCQS